MRKPVQSSRFKVQGSKLSKPDARCARLVPPLLDWFSANARDLPWRHTLDPYAIWVSEIMLQQTQVKTVIPYYERWLRELPDIRALATSPQDRVFKLWEGLGYYTRARNLQKAAQQITAEHRGEFPRNFHAVLGLAGIGRYTAGAICSIAFNQPKPILDGNVIRVLTRVFGIRENPRDKVTNEKLWRLADQIVQAASADSEFRTPHSAFLLSGPCSALNQSLMELGATVCTPRQPACLLCPLRRQCVAMREKLTDELPNLDQRATATALAFHTFIVRRGARYLVRQRPAGVVNAHLWEFPNVEVTGATTAPQDSAARLLGLDAAPEPFAIVKHSITRYRITQHAFTLEAVGKTKVDSNGHRWLRLDELVNLAFTSAHKRLLAKLER